MNTKYYDGLEPVENHEVSEEQWNQISGIRLRAVMLDDDDLSRTELFDNGKLFSVNYFEVADTEKVKIAHAKEYPGTPFSVWSVLEHTNGYVWEFQSTSGTSCEATGYGKTLTDIKGHQLMGIEYDADRQILRVTKYMWQGNELRYIFEYDSTGQLFGITDVLYGDSVGFDDLAGQLEERSFYSEGFALPTAISFNKIPDESI